MKKILITGGLGFIGINVGNFLARQGYECYLIDNFYKIESKKNIDLIKDIENIKFLEIDITNKEKIENLIKEINFYAVLNFAGQVAMSKSIENPLIDLQINTLGNFYLLDSLRKYSGNTKYLFTSSNKVYGDLSWDDLIELDLRYESVEHKSGFSENTKIDFSTPYGCSKGASDFYTIDFHKTYDLNTCVFRLSTIYGTNQFFTYDQGWIGWYLNEMLNTETSKPIEILGSGKQVRDVLFVTDLERLVLIFLENFNFFNGEVFNVGGGYSNSLSILELINHAELKLNFKYALKNNAERLSDQRYYVSNLDKLANLWQPEVSFSDGIDKYIDYIKIKK